MPRSAEHRPTHQSRDALGACGDRRGGVANHGGGGGAGVVLAVASVPLLALGRIDKNAGSR